MKYSLRKSFSRRRRKDTPDDDHVHPRLEHNGGSNSNSNLVKPKQSKGFLRRRRYSSSPPPASSPKIIKSKSCAHPYNNHINDDDDDDDDDDGNENDPFTPATNASTRVRPFDKLTDQIRKSFRNTLTRQRCRLESTNSDKRLILNTNNENRPVNPFLSPISTGLTSPITLSTQTTPSDEKVKIKVTPKRRKAPLAPTHMNKSMSLPNQNCLTFTATEHPESGYVSSSNDQQQTLLTKKINFNQSLRTRISLLFKKRHAKQSHSCIDEDLDHQYHDDQDESINKKLTLSKRLDTLRRSFHLGTRNSTSKGKCHLLASE